MSLTLHENEQIICGGHVDPEFKKELLSNSYALLHMINYDETFGLDVVEAMESGTQVIAMNRGLMPELILDGETKFLVNSVDELQRLCRGLFPYPATNVGNV